MIGLEQILAALLVVWGLAYLSAPLAIWTLAFFFSLAALQWLVEAPFLLLVILWLVFLILLVMNFPQTRQLLFTNILYRKFRKNLPPLSRTEQEAIDAGGIFWEAELFKGRPLFKNLLRMPKPKLTKAENDFLSNQVETLCSMMDDWSVTHEALDLPAEVWAYLKNEKFFGLVIPKEYGGLGFSALASSTIVQKIATRCLAAAVTTMVPNSLGPGELLLHYGTEEQKNAYLTKLANGEEIPCFALTDTEAGSDASQITDVGIVCRGTFEGQEMLGMRLSWNKRYITLAPVATVLGLAIKLYDPEGLLGDKPNLGMTLCLIPTQTEGVEIGSRHFPLNQPFMNGPTRGQDVFVPIDWIIGGPKKAGKGWRMLVESLSQGRGVSLPAISTAAAKLCYRTTGAYARIRKQFNTSIGRFEGVEESLARMAGLTYILEATRLFTLTAVDQNIRPAIGSAIAKYHMTELSRKIANDAMDIHGGRGIMLGPKNYLGRCYQSMPISITVEGANILTRSLIIFGQGLIRCHPYLREEMESLKEKDSEVGMKRFDKVVCSHIRYTLANFARLLLHSFTSGFFVKTPKMTEIKRLIQQLGRMSAALSVVADMALFFLGDKFKRRERLSARLGDVLSNLYLASSVIKYYHDFGHDKEDLPHVRWALQFCLHRCQTAFLEFFRNFHHGMVSCFLRFLVFPFGMAYSKPLDTLEHQLASHMMMPSSFRDRLSLNCYIGNAENSNIAILDDALVSMMAVEPALNKFETAKKKGEFGHEGFDEDIKIALAKGIVDEHEAFLLRKYEKLRVSVIQVDEFAEGEL